MNSADLLITVEKNPPTSERNSPNATALPDGLLQNEMMRNITTMVLPNFLMVTTDTIRPPGRPIRQNSAVGNAGVRPLESVAGHAQRRNDPLA